MAAGLKNMFSRKTPGFFLWCGGAVLLLLALLFLYSDSHRRSGGEAELAFSRNQRVTVTLDGTIEGAAPASSPATTSEPGTAEPAEETPPTGEPAPDTTERTDVVTPASAAPKPSITIIITGLGLNQSTLEQAAALPAPIAFAFSPYAAESQAQAEAASKQGREVLVELPLESRDANADVGPKALLAGNPEATNLANLEWALARVPGGHGVLVLKDEAFSARPEAFQPVLAKLAAHQVLVIKAGSVELCPWGQAIRAKQIEGAGADEVLDATPTPTAIDGKLAEIEHLARIRGHVLAVGHAYPATLQRIAEWSEKLPAKGYTLVSPSAFIPARLVADAKAKELLNPPPPPKAE